jgi:acyl transferase domain-containing protein
MGKIVDFDRFDSTFFGIVERIRDEVDPQSRMLLEVVYEAIVDAGK